MNKHPYLLAYMSGIILPTIAVPFGLAAFAVARFGFDVPIPIERAVIFPMALIPSFFGLWNMFFTRLHAGRRLPIGLHGALLPIIFIPLGLIGASAGKMLSIESEGIALFNAITIPYALFFLWIVVVIIAYYLIWKYIIAFFNRVLEIS